MATRKKVVEEEVDLSALMSDFMSISKKVDKNITSYGVFVDLGGIDIMANGRHIDRLMTIT